MEEELIEFLSGVPRDDVPEMCKLLSRIAKAVNPDLTAEAYLEAFGDFWATCFAYPIQPPVKGLQFMQAVFPGLRLPGEEDNPGSEDRSGG